MPPWEKAAWRQCAVFEGGFTLEAAEGVLDLARWPDVWVVDALQSLLDKSLLRINIPEATKGAGDGADKGGPVQGMFVSLQEYAQEKLAEANGEESATEERHGRWYARYGTDEMIDAHDLPGGAERLRELERELENMVSACRRAVARGDGGTAAMTYVGLSEVGTLPTQVNFELGKRVLNLPLADADRPRVLRKLGLAELAAGRKEARDRLEAALRAYRAIGDRRGESLVHAGLGALHQSEGRMEEAQPHLEIGLAMARETGNRRAEGDILGHLGNLHHEQGRMVEAQRHFEAALEIARDMGYRRGESFALGNLANLHADQGRIAECPGTLQRRSGH